MNPRHNMRPTDYPIKLFEDQKAWESWLARHGASKPGLWLRIAKKDSGLRSVNYAEALDVALCHGWIDGQKLPENDRTWLQKFTPRRARSIWSKINCEKTRALIAAGRMRPAGQAEIDRAKADGRWKAAYQPQASTRVPPDLAKALAASPKAKAFFAVLSSRNRFAILFRVTTAKKPETRMRRIKDFVARLAKGEAPYPQRDSHLD
ncbi:MAG TPA: YdeI/OmpD-associated family protein [Gemmatimonadales bacterium]|nr:YdeI/OmpD-associated family protein [Gemmatimonadales bacterium]